MSAVIGALRAELSASIAQFQSDMGKAADSLRGFTKEAKAISKELDSVGKKMSLAITAPLTLLAKASFDSAKQASQAIAQVQAAIESTGGASGKTAAQLDASASALARISVFNKADILRNVTAQLLTFGNIQGPVFDKAQKAVIDLASRMGGDLEGAAVKVGRALNDPIQGVQALTRVGVQFTTDQRLQIKALVDSGQGLKAQAIILDVLTQKYGGAAEALRKSSPDARFLQAWDDLKTTLGGIIVQQLTPLLDWLTKVFEAFQTLPGPIQTFIVVGAGILAVLGPLFLILGSIVEVIAVVTPLVVGLAAAFLELGAPIIAVVAAVAAAALAIAVFAKSVRDVLHGQFKQAWIDAKTTVQGIVAEIQKAWKSLTTPTKIAPPVIAPSGAGGGAPPVFDPHNEAELKKAAEAAKALQESLTQVGIALQHGLDDLNLPKATAEANALNSKIDDYVKRAKDAGVNTGAFAGQVAALRKRIAELQAQGIQKEAEAFARTVDDDTVAVQKFGKGGLDPLSDKLAGIDAQYQSLKDKITDEIKQNEALADSNDAARVAMDRLKKQLDQLESSHKKATTAAYAQNTAEQRLLDLQTQGANLAARNDIRDFTNARNGTGPISSAQQDLQDANDQLAKKQIDVAETLTKLEGQRDEAARQGYDDQVKRLDSEIDLQKQLQTVVKSTTADQLEAAKRINDAFKTFADDLTTQLSDALVNWKLSLQDVDATFKTLAENLFVKPFIQSGVDSMTSLLKGLIPGMGGKPDGSPGNPLYVTTEPGIGSAVGGSGGFGSLFSMLGLGPGTADPTAAGAGITTNLDLMDSMFAGGFATGGYIPPGQWGIVGEKGPEPVFGGQSGATVQPHGGGGVTQVFNISTPDANSFRMSERQIQRRMRQRLAAA